MQTKPNKPRQHFSRKIIDLDSLLTHRAHARAAGKTIVHCHGCFDIVHPGHIRYLQFAKNQGDLLLVSLTGDPHVSKGESRPYVPQELRAENLAALEFVDFVYINPQPTATELLAAVKPDIYIKGREYEHNTHPGFLKERAAVESYGGRVIFSSGDVVYSSSHIIDNYAQRLDLETEKLALFCQRYAINRTSLLEVLDNVVDRPYIVLGDMLLDRYQYCDATDIAADAPMLSLMPLEQRDFLGGAAMVARHLAGLGAEVTLITSLGTDDASDRAIDDLESTGVHILPLRNRKKIAQRTRFVVDNQKLFQLDESPATPTDTASEKYIATQLAKFATAPVTRASCPPSAVTRASCPQSSAATPPSPDDPTLILYDAGLGLITDSLATGPLAALSFAKRIGGTAGSRGRLLRLANADLLVAGERGLRAAFRDPEQGVSALAYHLLADSHSRAFFMPLGKKGLLCFDQRQDHAANTPWEGLLRSEYLASPSTNGGLDPNSLISVDRLGFDEALLAIAAAALGAGGNTHQAAYLGLAAALLEARSPGHIPLGGHELQQLLQSRPELA